MSHPRGGLIAVSRRRTVADVWSGSDDFTGTDGASPKTFWAVTKSATDSSVTIQGNKLRLNAGTAGSFTGFARATLDDVETANREWSIPAFTINGTADKFISIHWRGDANWNANDQMEDGWRLLFRSGATQDWIWYKRVGSVETQIATAAFTTNAATINVKVRSDGNVQRIKIWSGAEPTNWTASIEDSALAAQTRFAVTINGGAGTENTRYVDFDSVAASAPSTLDARFIQELGTATSNAAGTTVSVNFSGNLKPMPGDCVLVWCVRDNVASDPATGDSISASPGSPTWVRTAIAAGTTTQANGLVLCCFRALITAGWASGTNTITWTLPSRTAKAMLVEHYRSIQGVRGSPTSQGYTASPMAHTMPAPQAGDIIVAGIGWEYAAGPSIGQDTDTTNGTWDAMGTVPAGGGTTNTGVKVGTQRKTVNASGAQTYNSTHSISPVDAAIIGICLQPA